jgi:Gram-negative bacterial TonB protein C-terminal
MRSRYWCSLLVFALSVVSPAWTQSGAGQNSPKNGGESPDNPQSMKKVPTGVILVKGAWPSASDSVTPVPEGGSVTNNVFTNEYFGMTYALPKDWTETYKGPPPSESGRYVLAQIRPADTYKGESRGHILITAQDMFFTPLPTTNALELIAYEKDNLESDYKLELAPTETKIAGRSFSSFGYWSPVAEMHWYVVGTEIRCHAVEFVLTSRDTKLLESLVQGMNKMELPVEASPAGGQGGGAFPVCLKDYAKDENVIARVDPILTEHRFAPVPVRIIIDKGGKVKHIHFLSAFPDQAKTITDALQQWKFKPYLKDGQPVEVETGIMFGRAPPAVAPSSGPKSSTE